MDRILGRVRNDRGRSNRQTRTYAFQENNTTFQSPTISTPISTVATPAVATPAVATATVATATVALPAVAAANPLQKPKKYLFSNGVMTLNPAFEAWKAAQSGAPAPKARVVGEVPLAIVSSMEDIAYATEQQKEVTGISMQLAESTVASLEIMQDEDFTKEFAQPGESVYGSDVLDGLTNFFAMYEVPVGLVNKLLTLQLYNLKFIIDDSGSMNAPTDSMLSEASNHVLRGQARSSVIPMTRWQEAETRLHNIMDILAFIPTKSIEIRFLNAKNLIILQRTGKTVEQFTQEAHSQIVNAFSTIAVKYRTPTLRVLRESFDAAAGSVDPTMHYLFTDGVPSDASVQQVADLIKTRRKPGSNPLTLISCTDEDVETEWMKQVEEIAPFCAELDDFADERDEVLKDQGVGFPYTKGYWLISQLVAAINPYDLDAIDENLPFTKNTLDNMLGRVHTPQEYQYYFVRNPHASLYMDLYPRFLKEVTFARKFVPSHEQSRREAGAGYINGERKKAPPPSAYLASKLRKITQEAANNVPPVRAQFV